MIEELSSTTVFNDRKYPSVVLGLDISTACIGVSIVADDGVNQPEIKYISHIMPKVPKDATGIKGLILRKEIFEKEFLKKISSFGITECIIEAPILHAMSGSSSVETVTTLIRFNTLLSDSVYRILGIVPSYVSSHYARMLSYPQLLSIRKFNKKGEVYDVSTIERSLKKDKLVLFGQYPFDCDKKSIMMNLVSEEFPNIPWVIAKNGELKKQNYDACDSLVCVMAYINAKKNGPLTPSVKEWEKTKNEDGTFSVKYVTKVWDREYEKELLGLLPAKSTKKSEK